MNSLKKLAVGISHACCWPLFFFFLISDLEYTNLCWNSPGEKEVYLNKMSTQVPNIFEFL